MGEIVLPLRECADGWRVFNGQQPLFWLPDYEDAMATALTVASVHVDIREVAASIELQMLDEEPAHVTTACA